MCSILLKPLTMWQDSPIKLKHNKLNRAEIFIWIFISCRHSFFISSNRLWNCIFHMSWNSFMMSHFIDCIQQSN
ncbi:unnamed protein product [Blepharisma stoltei]|uniref:Uncharacterized protein n=1 Tax=Blepharisma stoltei TaxID=1481888 RepID=A0AAU9IM67_9CILI|nr:unnamed protein product [Blepharisma stoltei]